MREAGERGRRCEEKEREKTDKFHFSGRIGFKQEHMEKATNFILFM